MKTCRVAETRARQLPQVMSPKNLRLSLGSKIILEIHINCMMYGKKWRRRSPSSDHQRSEGICRNWNSPLTQRRPTSNRRCISTIPWKALQFLISKIESYKKMLTSPLYAQKASRKPDAMVVQEKEVSAQYISSRSKGKVEVSFI